MRLRTDEDEQRRRGQSLRGVRVAVTHRDPLEPARPATVDDRGAQTHRNVLGSCDLWTR